MSNIPKLRFPEFTDAWEKCKLGEIATINPKSTLPQTFNYVDLESVVGTEMRSYKIEKLYSAPSRAQRLAKYGDIFYQTVRPYQKNNYLFELDDENYVFSTGYAQIRSKIYPYFLFTLIQNDRFVNEVLDNCTGTSYPAINATDLKNITIFISNNPTEQQKIGNLFKQLDRLITLHKRKWDDVILLKKALLQKMFPKNGSDFPEIRFPEFTDAWEKYKVKEIFKVTRGNVLSTNELEEKSSDYPYPVYSSQTKNDGLLGFYNQYLYENAITWTTDGANAGTVKYRDKKFYCTNVCGVLISANGYANEMVSEALNLIAYRFVSKVGNPKLMNNVMSEIEISLPTLPEQQKIGNLFKQLDRLITLHKRQHEHYQLLKKALLQQMFV
ncbi:restriction endonuclease subunit S [Avibacterium gallinarum]|uniref:restriction endonuclease subunit S n=1 Tax=Avibacterium gallinarum TaxID=755 RepID=UPI003BF8E743